MDESIDTIVKYKNLGKSDFIKKLEMAHSINHNNFENKGANPTNPTHCNQLKKKINITRSERKINTKKRDQWKKRARPNLLKNTLIKKAGQVVKLNLRHTIGNRSRFKSHNSKLKSNPFKKINSPQGSSSFKLNSPPKCQSVRRRSSEESIENVFFLEKI